MPHLCHPRATDGSRHEEDDVRQRQLRKAWLVQVGLQRRGPSGQRIQLPSSMYFSSTLSESAHAGFVLHHRRIPQPIWLVNWLAAGPARRERRVTPDTMMGRRGRNREAHSHHLGRHGCAARQIT